jgi:hypothetical protein
MRALLVLLALAGTAHADYAIVVGSNAGGAGQETLRYAEDDARKVGALLVELGGYTTDQVDVVVHPSPGELRDRLAKLGERVAADVAAGKQTRVFFYYSGHARATAIDLGSDELPLTELRQRLFALNATLTVVVLDACQSGAFSRVKGAQPAADFSFSSRQHLDASGVAVLASSSGSELSQESVELRGSYFTHHLLVGLRGAGDTNGDGQVSLDEAYRYAYHQTLLATAETAVGGQHVTFEADLKGHGEVALSFPRAATQAITLPPAVDGQTLVWDKRAKTVVAETYKAKGAAVRIAVAPGDYEVLVRHGHTLSRCDVVSGSPANCKDEQIRTEATKGGGFERPNRVELSLLAGGERQDAYTDNLKAFSYYQALAPSVGVQAVGLRQLTPYVWAGGLASLVGMPAWKHDIVGGGGQQKLEWQTTTLAAVGRGEYPLGRHFATYAQLSAGLGIGHTKFTGPDGMTNEDNYFGPAFGVAAGMRVEIPWITGLGFGLGYAFDYAPVISDLIGNTHASGGHRLTLAATWGF